MDRVNVNTVNEVFQGIITEFSEMDPANLDILKGKVLNAIHKLGACLMEWKLTDWDESLQKDKCDECGGKTKNQRRHRQVATYVSDVCPGLAPGQALTGT